MRQSRTILSLAVAILGFVANAQAVSINIDFNNGGATNQSPGSSAVAGPYASAGWYNNVDLTNAPFFATAAPTNPSTSLLTLKDNTGANTTAQFGMNNYGYNTLAGPATNSPAYGAAGSANAALTADQQLYNGATSAGPAAYVQEVSLFNIPYASYDVYVLTRAQDGAVGYPYPTGGYGSVTSRTNYDPGTQTATLGSTYWFYSASGAVVPASGFSYLPATGTTQGTATQEANYVLFSGLTSSSAIIDLQSPNFDGNAGAYITGVQIVDTSVPEPTCLGLLALAGLSLVARRRQA